MSILVRTQFDRMAGQWHYIMGNSPLMRWANSNHITSTSTAACTVLMAFILHRDYRTFMSLGAGGLPHNVIGWLVSVFLFKPLAFWRDPRSTKPYDNSTETSYLGELFPPRRHGGRPKISSHPIPHRQLDQLPSEDARRELVRRFGEIAAEATENGFTILKKSGLERHTEALFVAKIRPEIVSPSAATTAKGLKGEFAHVHATGDFSLHLILSPADCKKVLDAEWGERHAFAGSALVRRLFNLPLPITYTLIYAPRNKEEVDVVCDLLKGSIAYMTGRAVDFE